MIEKFSSAIAKWLVTEGTVKDSDERIFAYAAYSLVFGMSPIFIILFLGSLLGKVQEGLLLVAPFMLLRKFSGGYHLHSPLLCVVTSTLLLALSLCAVTVLESTQAYRAVSYCATLATICLWVLSPIDSAARRLSTNEIFIFKWIARVLSVGMLIVYFLLTLLDYNSIAAPIGIGIILAALLQLPCVLIRLHAINNRSF